MKLVFFNEFNLGVVDGEQVVDVSEVVKDIPRVGPGDLISRLIEKKLFSMWSSNQPHDIKYFSSTTSLMCCAFRA